MIIKSTRLNKTNKRHLSADGSLLLPSALRPRLLGVGVRVASIHKLSPTKATKIPKLFLLVIPIITILSLINGFLPSNFVFAATSLNLTLPSEIKIANIQPNSGLQKSSPSNISITTTAPFGYTLSIKTKDGTALKNGSNSINTIATAMSEADFQSKGTNNTWGYIPSKLNNSTNANFQPANTTETILGKTTQANASQETYSITIGAKVDSTIPAGTYSNTFVIVAAANTVTYSITYHANDGKDMPSNVSNAKTTENTVTLENKTPTRANYNFKGWCNANTTNETCSGTVYQPNTAYPLTNGTNNINLYAMWESAGPPPMADFTCTLGNGATTTLTDARDGHTYKVAKLADGKCWMTENLRLGDSQLKNRTLTTADSDVGKNITLPSSSASGSSSNNTHYLYVDSNYGGYYSWYTATAEEGIYSKSSGDVAHSICPKGWKLPTQAEYSALWNASGSSDSARSSTLRSAPANLVLSGSYRNSSPNGQGSGGYYWSSTAYSTNSAYNLSLYSSGGGPSSNNYKVNGFTVRCVARQ